MKIFIKNMVCDRCINAVESIFNNLHIKISTIDLGEVETESFLNTVEIEKLDERLKETGFQILEDSAKKLIEKVKNIIILKINDLDISEDFILSEFLSDHLHKEYSAISKTFSQNVSFTLEQYFILQKIEKVKELLLYNEFSLTEISLKLGYRSVQHLSSQFKNTTGITPSAFKMHKEKTRISLDKI